MKGRPCSFEKADATADVPLNNKQTDIVSLVELVIIMMYTLQIMCY